MGALRSEVEALGIDLDEVTQDVDPSAEREVGAAREALAVARTAVEEITYSRRRRTQAQQAVERARAAVESAVRTCREIHARTSELRQRAEQARERAQDLGARLDTKITLESEIPDGYPQKHTIESAIRNAVATCPGTWMVRLQVSPTVTWWTLTVQGSGFDWLTPLDGPEEQCPRFIHARLTQAMRVAFLQRLLRESR